MLFKSENYSWYTFIPVNDGLMFLSLLARFTALQMLCFAIMNCSVNMQSLTIFTVGYLDVCLCAETKHRFPH